MASHCLDRPTEPGRRGATSGASSKRCCGLHARAGRPKGGKKTPLVQGRAAYVSQHGIAPPEGEHEPGRRVAVAVRWAKSCPPRSRWAGTGSFCGTRTACSPRAKLPWFSRVFPHHAVRRLERDLTRPPRRNPEPLPLFSRSRRGGPSESADRRLIVLRAFRIGPWRLPLFDDAVPAALFV